MTLFGPAFRHVYTLHAFRSLTHKNCTVNNSHRLQNKNVTLFYASRTGMCVTRLQRM